MIWRLGIAAALAGCSGSEAVTDAASGTDDASVDASLDAPPGPIPGSAGCGMANTLATKQYVLRTITVANVVRTYAIWLPEGYDPQRRYPVIYQQHGCFNQPNREINNVPLDGKVGTSAIIVRGRSAGMCWDTATTGPDVPFWNAMVADVEARWCIDPAKRLLTGYSSGGFMTHRLACSHANMIRGIATLAGGQAESGCTGTVAALMIHDTNDPTVPISASIAARDSHLTRNGCNKTAPQTATDLPPCVAYTGCPPEKPVWWCQTSGQGHGRQDGPASVIFWGFLSKL